MKTSFLTTLVLAAPLAAFFTFSGDAEACGGCVVPPEVNTIVSSHRMALSISTKQTVLWDQIRYDGDPESWGWILPVKPGAVLEISTDAWFETLDGATTTSISAPPINCGGGSSFNCGCAASDSAGALEDGTGSGGGVTVLHRGTVGPFETVTLSTETPGVLNDWLTTAGYTLPADTEPVIDAYVAEGYDFIALKLIPGKGVDEMKPVRVVQPGASPTLPLRMVAIGTGAFVPVTLFVISEGRWEAKNFANALVPTDLLSWDYAAGQSNYGSLRDSLLAGNGGATWLTTYAKPRALLGPVTSGRGFVNFSTGQDEFGFPTKFMDTLGEFYVEQGIDNQESTDNSCVAAMKNAAESTKMVVNPCPPGALPDDPSCGTVSADEIDARVFICGENDEIADEMLDDIATALNGLHPNDVWLTRLEANLPRAALANDLTLQASMSQTEVNHQIQATKGTNVEAICGSGTILLPGASSGGDDRGTRIVVVVTLGAGLLAFARRRLRGARLPVLSNA